METTDQHIPGFQFDNYIRNVNLEGKGYVAPNALKTGTTIAGVIYKDGIVLGADTRSTGGNLIANKFCQKLHYLQPNIYCGGAGTAADLDVTTLRMSSHLELLRLNTGRQVPVVAACKMLRQLLFRYQGHIGAYLICGGVDKTGYHLYTIHAHGSSQVTPFTAMGSGSLASIAVLERRWKPDMELEDAKQLVRDCIAAGILNDLASGSHVNLCIINKDGAEIITPYDKTSVKGVRKQNYTYPKGTTDVLSTIRRPIEIISDTVVRTSTDDSMDTA